MLEIKTGILKAVTVPLAFAVAAIGQAQQLDINGGSNNYINEDLDTYSQGYNYGSGGATVNVAGVGFTLATWTNGDVGIAASNYSSAPVAVFDYTGLDIAGSASESLYTLINSGDGGSAGTAEGTIEVFGTSGAYAELTLTEGMNIRDHYDGSYCDTLSDPTVISTYFNGGAYSNDPTFGPDRLDRQELDLGSSFAGQTITEVKFTFDHNGFPGGSPFLAGATFAPTPSPEPCSTALLLGGVGLVARRRAKARR